MTRFKELRRIEAALNNKNESELTWALWYCNMRIRITPHKRHAQIWRDRAETIEKALEALKPVSSK